MTAKYDAIVIGAGQNGLAAAALLAAKKKSVLVLERRDAIGGLCGAIDFNHGFRVPGILHDDGRVSPRLAKELKLERYGLEFRDAPPVFLAEAKGKGILLYDDPEAAKPELSAHDAEAYARYRAFMAKLHPLVDSLLNSPPPPLSPSGAGDFWAIARQGLKVWRLGRHDTLELMRVAPMCVADYLNELFQNPLLVEGLAAPAVLSTWAGPWSAGTNTNLLLSEASHGREIAGGPAALVAALEKAARENGAEIRTQAEVARIRVEKNRAAGVTLQNGESIDASVVVVTSDPKRAFLDLIAPGTLPIHIEDEYRRIRMRGTAAKVHLALSGPLELAARPGQHFEHIRIGGGHIDDLERAFDAVKYKENSKQPHLEIRVPTVSDSSLAPQGQHVASILVSYVSHDVKGGWTNQRRINLLESVLTTLERHAPGVRKKILGQELLTPADLETRYALTGGQLHHGELALDQILVLRPTPSAARYATSVPGIFLGGSGSHGGGGVSIAPGVLAAEAALSA